MKIKNDLYRNAIFNVIYKFLNVLFPLIFSVYITRTLFATGVGKVIYAQNIAQYFVLIAPLGLPSYGTRAIARIKAAKKSLSDTFSELFIINAVSTLICSFIYYSIISFVPFFVNERHLYYVTGLLIIINVFNIDWFYQGNKDFQYIAVRNFIIKIITLLILFIFVRSEKDYIKYATIYVLMYAGNYLFNISRLKKYGIHLKFTNIKIKKHLKPLFTLLGTAIAVEVYTLLDTTMLGIWCTEEYVAYYNNSIKLVKVIVGVIAAIGGVLLPYLSQYYIQGNIKKCSDTVNQIIEVLLYLFIPCCFGILILADEIILVLYGEAFMPSILTLRIGSLLILVLGFSNLFGTQVLLTFGHESKLFFCTILGAISNIAMNIFLIPRYQHNGAALASVISESLVTLVTFIYAARLIQLRYQIRNFIKIIVSSILMILIVYIIKSVLNNNIYILIVGSIAGITSYLALNILLKNPINEEIKNLVRKK